MKAAKPIKIGIFGLGRGYDYTDSILMNNGEITAICDTDEKKRSRMAEKLGNHVAVYADFDSFIEHDMDAVFLANCFHEHAGYAIRCLEKSIHVLSECLSNGTMADGVALVRAAEKSSAIYMLAENYPFMLFNQEMKRVYNGGTLGKAVFAEGEYNHNYAPDNYDFLRNCRPFEKHWRNYLPRTYYITHSLAPLMYITGTRPKKVSALPCFSPLGEEYPSCSVVGDLAAIITTLNEDDSVFRVTGCSAFGASENSYRICATKGQIENVRGTDGKVMLRYNDWQIPEGMQDTNFYKPEWNDDSADLIDKTGHGGGDYFVMNKFFEAINNGTKPVFDVYFATTTASVAILAHRSILAGGVPMEIPDFHKEEDRVKYENDILSPFPSADGGAPTLPACSHPDFRPSEDQVKRYLQIVSPSEADPA